MGIGVFAGKKRSLNAEIRIAHYSNGNIFPQNNGVMIPLTLAVGYSFN
ncbi:MAG: acyloxyacyl hydrolase [Chitinophagales bacterium]